jgi:hypothetical protein
MRKQHKAFTYAPTKRDSIVVGTYLLLPYVAIALVAAWGVNKLLNKLPQPK